MRPSEIAAGVGVVCLLLALLTWLLVRGIATDLADYSTTLRIFDDFALAEGSLHKDVLQAPAGLLTDYDPLEPSASRLTHILRRRDSFGIRLAGSSRGPGRWRGKWRRAFGARPFEGSL